MRAPITLTFLALVLLSAACTRPYEPPVLEQADRGFPGLLSLLPEQGAGRVDVVLVHGMCSHLHRDRDDPATEADENWVGRRLAQFAAAVGGSHARRDAYEPVPIAGGTRFLRRYREAVELGGGRGFDITLYAWGGLFDASRARLEYENNAEIRRAGLNDALKRELFNRCLVDAVGYVGARGDTLRSEMRMALCQDFGGRMQEGICAPTGRGSRTPLALAPESLGSKVLFDAVAALAGGGAMAQTGARLAAIHLLSNQIPLLDEASIPPTPAEVPAVGPARAARPRPSASLAAALAALDGGAGPLGLAAPETSSGVVPVVAYVDPNDPFGYRLNDRQLAGVSPRFRLTNVLVSNVPTFGVGSATFADPLGAHAGYERPEVFALVAGGSDAR